MVSYPNRVKAIWQIALQLSILLDNKVIIFWKYSFDFIVEKVVSLRRLPFITKKLKILIEKWYFIIRYSHEVLFWGKTNNL